MCVRNFHECVQCPPPVFVLRAGLARFGPRAGPTGQRAWRAGLSWAGGLKFVAWPIPFQPGWRAGPSGRAHFAIPMFTSRPSPMEWSLIFLCHIKALSDGMVIDFLSLHQGPLRWNGHWFSCLHQGPLRWNGHWFALFTSRPSPMEWSLIFFVYIKALSDGMVIDFLVYIKAFSDGMVIYFLLHIKALSDGMVIDFFVTTGSSPSE